MTNCNIYIDFIAIPQLHCKFGKNAIICPYYPRIFPTNLGIIGAYNFNNILLLRILKINCSSYSVNLEGHLQRLFNIKLTETKKCKDYNKYPTIGKSPNPSLK